MTTDRTPAGNRVDGPAGLLAGCASHTYITHAYGCTLHKCTGFVDGFNPFSTIFMNSLVMVFFTVYLYGSHLSF